MEGRSKPRSEIKHTGGGQTSWAQWILACPISSVNRAKALCGTCLDVASGVLITIVCYGLFHQPATGKCSTSSLEHVQVSWEKMSQILPHLQLHPVYVHIRCRKSNWCTATRHWWMSACLWMSQHDSPLSKSRIAQIIWKGCEGQQIWQIWYDCNDCMQTFFLPLSMCVVKDTAVICLMSKSLYSIH